MRRGVGVRRGIRVRPFGSLFSETALDLLLLLYYEVFFFLLFAGEGSRTPCFASWS